MCFSQKKGNQIQDETNKVWSSVKDKDNAEHLVKQKIIDLTAIRRRAQGGLHDVILGKGERSIFN
jgi:hypothetical protein